MDVSELHRIAGELAREQPLDGLRVQMGRIAMWLVLDKRLQEERDGKMKEAVDMLHEHDRALFGDHARPDTMPGIVNQMTTIVKSSAANRRLLYSVLALLLAGLAERLIGLVAHVSK